jgi:hypothetical protein
MQGLDVPEMGTEGYAGYTDYYPQPVSSPVMGYPLIPMSKEKAEAVGKAFLESGKEKS